MFAFLFVRLEINLKILNMNTQSDQEKWYKKPMAIYILCLVFPPVGIYQVWKNQEFTKTKKIILTVLSSFVVIGFLGGKESEDGGSDSSSESGGYCCCQYTIVDETCYEYVSEDYCDYTLKGSLNWCHENRKMVGTLGSCD